MVPGQEHTIQISAFMLDTSDGNIHVIILITLSCYFVVSYHYKYLHMSSLQPEKRGCYFTGEKNLTLFKVTILFINPIYNSATFLILKYYNIILFYINVLGIFLF